MDVRALFQASAVALVLVLAGCGKPATFPAAPAQGGADASDPGYRAPPGLRGALRSADGSVSLNGQAQPSWKIRMASSAGARAETMADGQGAWTASLGPVSEPALYRLAEEDPGGQRVEAQGLIAILPGVPTVALLRAGDGAEVQGAAKDGLQLLAVDYDRGGGTVVSGRARATSPVRLLVDGQPAIEGAAGPDGRFSLKLPKPLEPGAHRLQLLTPQAKVEATVPLTAPAPPADGPFRASSAPYGWRIDWVTDGGGAQATLIPTGN